MTASNPTLPTALRRAGVALFALGACTSTSAGCDGTRGQLLLAFQTDMSPPKDIDAIEILATLDGAVVYNRRFERVGAGGELRLPATLGFLTPDDPSQVLRVRLVASRADDDSVQVLREVVTTVPEGRNAVLQVPLQYLCDGTAEVERDASGAAKRDENGALIVKSACGDGETCVAGACVASQVDATALPEYEVRGVFGGGTGAGDGACFDTTKCFGGATSLSLDLDSYTADPAVCRAATAGGEINVALLTQGRGICGSSACYVPLDAGNDAGWKQADGYITLPPAVCAKVKAGGLVGLAVAPADASACPKKSAGLPTCGLWAATGLGQWKPPALTAPTLLAAGQAHPVALAVQGDRVYWITGSTFAADGAPNADGAVKMIPRDGGDPLVIADKQPLPRDLVVDAASGRVVWTNAARVAPAAPTGLDLTLGSLMTVTPDAQAPSDQQPAPTSLLGAATTRLPEGIALLGSDLYWSELWDGRVLHAGLSGGDPLALQSADVAAPSPYRLAASSDVVCWTNQGNLNQDDGSVACNVLATDLTQIIASGQRTPRAIAIDADEGGRARSVTWANLGDGTVVQAELGELAGGGEAGAPRALASQQGVPNGVAIDAAYIYWTNRDAGTVQRWSKADGALATIARDQLRPGAIAADDAAVYWLNEGSPDAPDGTPARDGGLVKLTK